MTKAASTPARSASNLPTLATLWIGQSLGWLEQLCLRSMLDQGHDVVLYSFGDIGGVPDGIECRDGRAIWAFEPDLLRKTAPSFIADLFRISLMHKTDEVWVDADMLCVKPLDVDGTGYLIGFTPWHAEVNNAVMRLPAQSPALDLLSRYVADPTMRPSWVRPALRQRIEAYDGEDRLSFLFQIKRTILGPPALTFCLKQTGEDRFAAEPEVLSPIPWQFAPVLFNPHGGEEGWITDDTKAIHLWSAALGWHRKTQPHPDSFIGRALANYSLD